MATIVSAPADLVVATSHGIDVRFAGFDLVPDLPPHATAPNRSGGVQVKLEGVRGLQTRQRDVQFEEARLAWAEQLKKHGPDVAGPAPTMPGVPVLDRVGVLVADDVGTEYRLLSGHVAGDGTEWSASWAYLPLPPKEAQNLSLRFTLDGMPTGKECELRLR